MKPWWRVCDWLAKKLWAYSGWRRQFEEMKEGCEMKAKWTELREGKSFLVLVFGHVSAEVVDLGPAGAINGEVPRTWGILTHPFVPETQVGTLEQAQTRAEEILRGILGAAANGLGFDLVSKG